MSDWMVDTFIYTALLIGLVLLIRRPVMRQFGPQVAYALWALPLLRFIMPPIVLPAWMAPSPEPVADPSAAGSETIMFILPDGANGDAATFATDASVATAETSGFMGTDLLLPIWIVGALVFLGWRIREYRRMRRDLLANARPMGESGNIRLVETPAVSAPVAFGVRDKVVALPVDFMTLLDVNARDMAIAHELEHHRGHDLLANIAAQPLLALHWFNPLAWWGWRAMRRDQEAACDARVVAGRAQSERAAYAEVIAGFAAGEHLALAAPMACPVLGEKSIIHRLRSLTMSDISSTRRKLGIAAITTTALALPLTASISYAAPDAPLPPLAPEAPLPPEALPPVPPAPPAPPEPPLPQDAEDGVTVHVIEDEDGNRSVVRQVRVSHNGDMSEEEVEALMEELERELERVDEEVERHVELAMQHAERAAEISGTVVRTDEDAEACGDDGVVETELSDGRRAIMICRTNLRMTAIAGLQEAIAEIANDPDIPEDMRTRMMRQLESTIVQMRELQSSRFPMPQASAKPARARMLPGGRGPADARALPGGRNTVDARAMPSARARTGTSAAAAAAPSISMVSPITGEVLILSQ